MAILVLSAIACVLVFAPRPGHVPWRPGVRAIPGPDRFVIDEGMPTPYHDRSGRVREALAGAWAWWTDLYSLAVASLLAAIGYVVVRWVIVPGVAGGWWPIARDFAASIAKGGY